MVGLPSGTFWSFLPLASFAESESKRADSPVRVADKVSIPSSNPSSKTRVKGVNFEPQVGFIGLLH